MSKAQTMTDRWKNPKDWETWKVLLHLEMELHEYPLGKGYDADSYKNFFDNGYGPHEAIEEDFNAAC